LLAAALLFGSGAVTPADANNTNTVGTRANTSTTDGEDPLNGQPAVAQDNDPFIDFTTIHDNGAHINNTAGTVNALSSRTSDLGGGATAGYVIPPQVFNFSANQRLVVTGMLRVDSFNTNYGSSPAAPGIGNAASMSQNAFTLAGFARYYINSAYFDAALSGDWGHASYTDHIGAASGNFATHGYDAFVGVGNVYTLLNALSAPSRSMPTKAPPKPIGGYLLQLDAGAHVGYASETDGGYTDISGFQWGNETLNYWDIGAHAKLFMTIPRDNLIWTPYVAATFDHEFDYSNTLTIPTQAAFAGTALGFGGDQTFWGARAGISAETLSNWVVGVQGAYRQSSEFTVLSGQAFVRYIFR
jgi:hypothetical protein